MNLIEENKKALFDICIKYQVEKMYAFGSVLTNQFNSDKSDVDLVVELKPLPVFEKGEKLISLWDELENLFKRKVDLLTDQPIRNAVFKQQIERTKKLIYENGSTKAFN
jgi:predicted nucleotidyltransferase